MNDEFNSNIEPTSHRVNGRSHGRSGSRSRSSARPNGHGYASASPPKGGPQFGPSDLLPFIGALMRNWKWLFFGGLVMAALGFFGGTLLWKNRYTASAELLREAPTQVTEILGNRELDPNTYASLLRAPELLKRVGVQATPQIPAESLAKKLNVTAERNSDVLLVAITATDKQSAVNLANLYANEAIKFTQELQTNAAARVGLFVSEQLVPLDNEITELNKMPVQSAARTSVNTNGANAPLIEKLQAARMELAAVQARYMDKHPLVREQQAQVDALENQLKQMPGSQVASTAASSGTNAPTLSQEHDPAFMHTKLQSLLNARLTLLGQKQAAQWVEEHPPGTCKLLAPATIKEVISHNRAPKVAVLAGFGGLLGMLFVGSLVLLVEAMDSRLKTPADVRRVTQLPVVATAGNFARLTEAEQKNWSFRALTSLQNLLSPSPNQGFICGITSSENGEGRSTWVKLLAEAASQRGFRVLTIVASPPETDTHERTMINGPVINEKLELESPPPENGSEALVVTNVLSTPEEVTQKLMGPNPEPVVRIPLPGWVWNLDRRKQWQAALRHWGQIDNIALIVELPPASMPETVLLAENLPNLLWLADADKAKADKTVEQLETLRNARCNLVGAVMNRTTASTFQNRFARWFGSAALVVCMGALSSYGQETNVVIEEAPPLVNTNLSFSVVSPAQRAEWQQRLTLGPGDVVTIGLWGEPTMTRTEIAIGPDGRIGFAEAQDVLASGLTVDELRIKLNDELGKHRRTPEVMVTPVAFRSKRYYMLGRVMTKGVYILDRPITVLEAVARAHGFESGLVERNIVGVADFSRSFLMRKGQRIPLNFENLFQSGDLSQNISIEPGDYLYFPGTNIKEVYVVGEVRLPGPTPYTPNLTLMAAISSRAGYTEDAYKGRVLVVRGSLNKPQTFVLETKDILAGKTPDFQLQPKDIIFVSKRPFVYGEQLADRAITAFLQSLVTATVGVHVIKPYQE